MLHPVLQSGKPFGLGSIVFPNFLFIEMLFQRNEVDVEKKHRAVKRKSLRLDV